MDSEESACPEQRFRPNEGGSGCRCISEYRLHSWHSTVSDVPVPPVSSTSTCISTANLSGRAGLRSAERGDLQVVPRTATELGKRSFSALPLRSSGTVSGPFASVRPSSPQDSFGVDCRSMSCNRPTTVHPLRTLCGRVYRTELN